MSALFQQQQALLLRQFQILERLERGARYSASRLPIPLSREELEHADVAERIAAMNDRCTKMQDQLAGALKQAHAMLGERYRSYADVVEWAVSQGIVPTRQDWLDLRAMRNRLTHDYDLEADAMIELVPEMKASIELLAGIVTRFRAQCAVQGLLPGNGST